MMKLSRRFTTKINFFLDQFIPPIIRDSKLFLYLPFRFFFKDKIRVFLSFKDKAPFLSEQEFGNIYKETREYMIQRKTDLNDECVRKILESIIGPEVLEVGCGKGFLAIQMGERHSVTATDIFIADSLVNAAGLKVKFLHANLEKLPFSDNQFDTVVCAHTLEHIQNFFAGIYELRRVAKKRLIIVVPKQRPYRHTFDLHLHFFPYIHSFLVLMRPDLKKCEYFCQEVGGDLFYIENKI